jgi:hypothetical protein
VANKREQIRLLGNAVTPPAMRDLIAAVAGRPGSSRVGRFWGTGIERRSGCPPT